MKRFLILSIILAFATPAFAQGEVVIKGETYTVERVLDGDTLKLTNGGTIQLIGINAPDKGQEGAEEATEFVKNLGLEGKEVYLEFDVQERDKYGRLLVYCLIWMDNYLELYDKGVVSHFVTKSSLFPISLNATIIKSGYATPRTAPPNVKHADLLQELYEEAKENKRGLWKENKSKLEDGYHKEYYENGQLKWEAKIKNGCWDGVHKLYYENGKLQKESNFENCKQNGLTKSYDENGHQKREWTYINGKCVKRKYFDSDEFLYEDECNFQF